MRAPPNSPIGRILGRPVNHDQGILLHLNLRLIAKPKLRARARQCIDAPRLEEPRAHIHRIPLGLRRLRAHLTGTRHKLSLGLLRQNRQAQGHPGPARIALFAEVIIVMNMIIGARISVKRQNDRRAGIPRHHRIGDERVLRENRRLNAQKQTNQRAIYPILHRGPRLRRELSRRWALRIISSISPLTARSCTPSFSRRTVPSIESGSATLSVAYRRVISRVTASGASTRTT